MRLQAERATLSRAQAADASWRRHTRAMQAAESLEDDAQGETGSRQRLAMTEDARRVQELLWCCAVERFKGWREVTTCG